MSDPNPIQLAFPHIPARPEAEPNPIEEAMQAQNVAQLVSQLMQLDAQVAALQAQANQSRASKDRLLGACRNVVSKMQAALSDGVVTDLATFRQELQSLIAKEEKT